MNLFTLVYVAAIAATLISCASANADADILDPVEKFNRLCVNEYTKKVEFDENLSLESSEEIYEKYKEFMDARIALGAELGIHFCPQELIGHLKSSEDTRINQLTGIGKRYDEKCRLEARSRMLCNLIDEALVVNKPVKKVKTNYFLVEQKSKYCQEHEEAHSARVNYQYMFDISHRCDAKVVSEAEREAEKEAAELLKLPFKVRNDTKHNSSSSLGGKICNLINGCFKPSKKVQDK